MDLLLICCLIFEDVAFDTFEMFAESVENPYLKPVLTFLTVLLLCTCLDVVSNFSEILNLVSTSLSFPSTVLSRLFALVLN